MIKKSLFTRLLITHLVVILASTLVFGLLFSQLLKDHLLETKEQELIAKGTQLSAITGQYLQGQVSEQLLNYRLTALEDFLDSRVWIVDKNGKIIALSQGTVMGPGWGMGPGNGQGRGRMMGQVHQGMMLSAEETSQVLDGGIVTRQGANLRFDEPMLSVAVPIISGENLPNPEVIGAVFLNTPVFGVTEAINSSYALLLFAFFVSAAIASILAFYLSRTIARPLREMNKSALAMAQGDYLRRVEVSTDDEVNELAESLNHLAGELNQSVTALKEEKGKVELMLTSISEGILAVDRTEKILRVNPAAEKLLNLDKNHLENNPVSSLPYPELFELFQSVLQSGQSSARSFSAGSLIIRALVSPIVDDGKILGSIGILQDISQAERLETMREDFVANVSHELRTPLTVIRGFIEALLDKVDDDPKQQERYYRLIQREAMRLERLITDLLDLSRLKSGKVELDLEEVEIEPIAIAILDRFKPQAEDKQINLILNSPDSPVRVLGDGDRLEQLLIIFIDNALRYTKPGGTVAVNIKSSDNEALVSISDNGAGIPHESLPYIWDRFYKVDQAHTPSDGGTGLGLYIAKQLIDLHKGRVRVKSEPGRGSTFEFSLKKA